MSERVELLVSPPPLASPPGRWPIHRAWIVAVVAFIALVGAGTAGLRRPPGD